MFRLAAWELVGLSWLKQCNQEPRCLEKYGKIAALMSSVVLQLQGPNDVASAIAREACAKPGTN